jgi:signal transduction histidine kinase
MPDVSGRAAPRRVVLAEDYDGVLTAMTRLLRPVCDVVGCVSDGAELLDAIERLRAEIVVLDLNMPGVDGLHTCRQIKMAAPDVDVIVCTAADDADIRTGALEAGASAFVSKFRLGDDLVAAIQRTDRSSLGLSRGNECDDVAEELRDVRGRFIDAQERERHRLSRELHDGVGQQLALLSSEVASLRELVASTPATLERVRQLLRHTEDIGSELHRVCQKLLPLSLERFGLAASIRRLCVELSEAHQIRIHLETGSLPSQIGQNVLLCVYRIVQEALCNVVKHSHANLAAVRLETHGNDIVVHVSDDGCGFDPRLACDSNGLGLVSMSERARHAGGSLTVRAQTGQGTHVEAHIPSYVLQES